MNPSKIEHFLARLRETHPDMVRIFTQGGCFELYCILRLFWPESRCWYVMMEGHVYTQIGNVFYDIRGKHYKLGPSAIELVKEEPHIFAKAHRWRKGTYLEYVEVKFEERCINMGLMERIDHGFD